jgi:predicted TIM-barrel fold metal-dependent hydrolase
MATRALQTGRPPEHRDSGLAIVDADFHNATGGKFAEYLPERWQRFLRTTGQRNIDHYASTTQQRALACRLDANPPTGGPPGSDPAFAREQLLDLYDISYAVINNIEAAASGNAPVDFEIAHARAVNDYNFHEWLSADPRWLASINLPADHPEAAAEEIERCVGMSDRFVQAMVGSRAERPLGNPKYWPMYEAASRHGIPVAFHVSGGSRYNHWTGVGATEYYYEIHSVFPLAAQTMLASMVFEGLFEQFPGLQIVCTELGWDWVVPFAWRLDATWDVLREEVPHLSRRPSEYIRDNVWFSTQPTVETEAPADFYAVYQQFAEFGLAKHLLFATDYPHWDMDSPFDAMPQMLSMDDKAAIFGLNAASLWGLELPDAARTGAK